MQSLGKGLAASYKHVEFIDTENRLMGMGGEWRVKRVKGLRSTNWSLQNSHGYKVQSIIL